MARFWRFFGGFSAGSSQTTLPFVYPWDRIALNSVSWAFAGHFTGIGCWKRKNTTISRLPKCCYLKQLLAFLRLAPKRRCLGAGRKNACAYLWTELHQTRFPRLLQAIPPESSIGNGKTPLLADWHGFGGFLAVFRLEGQLQDDAALRLPLARIAPNSVSWSFAGHSSGIKRCKRENTSISRLPQFCSLEQLWKRRAFFLQAPRRRCPALTSGPNYTKLAFPRLLQAIPPESSVGNRKTPLLADWHGFGGFLARGFSAGSKTMLSCAYPWPKLHPTRFLRLLQAITPESSVENGKIPVLADYPNWVHFAPWSNFWRFFGRLQDDAVLRLPLDRITPNSLFLGFCRPFHLNRA